uniref:Uncharacterized protein n=1 Tax=Lepeophtheirus salmonis TaxID=72036 RepID=A0A0K2UU41_LEPSM
MKITNIGKYEYNIKNIS